MTIKFKEQVEREMEIEIPCYRKNETFIVKVLGEHECLYVHVDGNGFSHHNGFMWGAEDHFKKGWSEATREEFDAAYNKFVSMLHEQMSKHSGENPYSIKTETVPENTF